jgi:predicted ribosomally synthesized peptide with SipW-like signal peptide
MKTKAKLLALVLCMTLLTTAAILGTVAYLTAEDEVVNTFTVGAVKIALDEAKVELDGTPVPDAARVKSNTYKLLPGHAYTKDPTVTVLAGSEQSYVRMTVAFTKSAALDAIFAPGGADLLTIFKGYDENTWLYKGNRVEDDTRTYEFWYKEPVSASDAPTPLDALFDGFTVPGALTNEQLAELEGMTITVNAHAIQADGFADADAAWAAFPAA